MEGKEMLGLIFALAVIVGATMLLVRILEALLMEVPWLPLIIPVLVGLFLLRAILQAVVKARAKALRRRERAARRQWLAGMVRLSREELLRLQAAWAAIERVEILDPNNSEYAKVQETRRQAVEFIQHLKSLADSQGKKVPESSAECQRTLSLQSREYLRALHFRDDVEQPHPKPVRKSLGTSIALVTSGLQQRLRAAVTPPRRIVGSGSVLLGILLVAGASRSGWWDEIGLLLLLAGGLIGIVLPRWRHTKA
jgi:hypothetical protein